MASVKFSVISVITNEKAIINEKIRLFLSMLLLSGFHKLPDQKCIRRRPPILLCKQDLNQSLVICSTVLFGISIFVTANNLINKTNSFCGERIEYIATLVEAIQ